MGQLRFLEQAQKGKWNEATKEECFEFIRSDMKWSKQNTVCRLIAKDGLYDTELCRDAEREIKSAKRRKDFDGCKRLEQFLVDNRQDVWFDNTGFKTSS